MNTLQALQNDGRCPQRAARAVAVVVCVAACLLLSGCRHKQAPPLLPAIVTAPVPQPPTPDAPMMKSPPPALADVPPVKVSVAKPKPHSHRKTAASTTGPASGSVAPSAVETAPAAVPAASPLGELSAGGESKPKSQQEATDLVVSGEHRLEALLKTKAGQQQEQTREVRHFLEQARQALTTGDAEGARTLATKAKLLMDDLEKWAAQ